MAFARQAAKNATAIFDGFAMMGKEATLDRQNVSKAFDGRATIFDREVQTQSFPAIISLALSPRDC